MMPVLRLGVVEPETEARLPAGRRQLLERIALERRGVHDVVPAGRRAEHRKPIVMLRGDDDVLHPGVLGDAHPFIRVELHRVELAGQLGVFGDRDFAAVHHPLAARRDGIQPPVDEHPELRLPEPVHAAVGLPGRLRGSQRGRRTQQ